MGEQLKGKGGETDRVSNIGSWDNVDTRLLGVLGIQSDAAIGNDGEPTSMAAEQVDDADRGEYSGPVDGDPFALDEREVDVPVATDPVEPEPVTTTSLPAETSRPTQTSLERDKVRALYARHQEAEDKNTRVNRENENRTLAELRYISKFAEGLGEVLAFQSASQADRVDVVARLRGDISSTFDARDGAAADAHDLGHKYQGLANHIEEIKQRVARLSQDNSETTRIRDKLSKAWDDLVSFRATEAEAQENYLQRKAYEVAAIDRRVAMHGQEQADQDLSKSELQKFKKGLFTGSVHASKEDMERYGFDIDNGKPFADSNLEMEPGDSFRRMLERGGDMERWVCSHTLGTHIERNVIPKFDERIHELDDLIAAANREKEDVIERYDRLVADSRQAVDGANVQYEKARQHWVQRLDAEKARISRDIANLKQEISETEDTKNQVSGTLHEAGRALTSLQQKLDMHIYTLEQAVQRGEDPANVIPYLSEAMAIAASKNGGVALDGPVQETLQQFQMALQGGTNHQLDAGTEHGTDRDLGATVQEAITTGRGQSDSRQTGRGIGRRLGRVMRRG